MDLIQERVPVKKALFFERTDMTSASETFSYEIYWICQRQGLKNLICLFAAKHCLLLMFASTICVTSFHEDPLSVVTVSKTYWKLWLQMPLWKLAFLRGLLCSSSTAECLVCLYVLLASFCCSVKSEDLFQFSTQPIQFSWASVQQTGASVDFFLSCPFLCGIHAEKKLFFGSFCYFWHTNSVMFILPFFA